MKKLVFIFAIALVAIIFNSCNKPDDAVVDKQYVKAFDGQFIAADGDIKLKELSPIVKSRTWSMYAKNSVHYNNAPFALVKGNEFILGSPANLWWAIPSNNPVTFLEPTGVYSNLTPDEDLRVVCESKNVEGKVAFLAILDFHPTANNFPMTINGYRLGDKLIVNADALTAIPGVNIEKIEVLYKLAEINLDGTIFGNLLNPEFQWSDIKYFAPVAAPIVPVGSGDVTLYDGFTHKVFGDIVIKIYFKGDPKDLTHAPANVVEKTITGVTGFPGQGLSMVLKSSKVGWYNSETITLNDYDIDVVIKNIVID